MNARLPLELRTGIVTDVLAWFLRCSGEPGYMVEPTVDTIEDMQRWPEVSHAIRAASYRTPYSDISDYMERWWFLPEFFGERARLHRTLRSDRARDLHDHPWHYVSIILEGGYVEEIEVAHGLNPLTERRRYRPGDVLFRHAEHRHRLEVDEGIDCWSLVLTSHNVREWGFWTSSGFVPWREYSQLELA